MTTATMTDMQQRVSELFDINNDTKVDSFIKELEGYGIETEEQLDDAYSGCYPSNEAFCEDMLCDVYSEAIDAMPIFLQTAIDWELVWYQSMRYDYFSIYHEGDYYFFNRNF
jgi:hypothetical protein